MPVNTIYIARHGFRMNWTNPKWENISATGLARDHPLSAYGEVQSKELAAYLANLPETDRPTAIFTSPYYRCIQTSVPIADALSLPLYVEFGLSEWYPPVTPGTGLHPRPTPADDLLRYFPCPPTNESSIGTGSTETKPTSTNIDTNTSGSYIDPRWTPTYLVTRKGESVAELNVRCEEFLRAFIGRVDGMCPSALPAAAVVPSTLPLDPAPTPASASALASRAGQGCHGKQHVGDGVGVGHERILLVSHAATTIALTRALTGDEEIGRGMRVGCCTLTTLHRTTPEFLVSSSLSSSSLSSPLLPPRPPSAAARDVIGRGAWTIRGTAADGSFLTGGVERDWGMADLGTGEGVVVEDPGVPASEGEEDGPNGVQVWWQTGLACPKM